MVGQPCSLWLPTPEADFLQHVLASVGQEGGSAHLGWAVGILLMTDASLTVTPWKESASSLTVAFTCLCLGEKHFTFILFFFCSKWLLGTSKEVRR